MEFTTEEIKPVPPMEDDLSSSTQAQLQTQTIPFPENFIWGTSTAAAQIETAFDHDWKGVMARDGYRFERTADHELRRDEDLEYIAQFGHSYRMSLDWSRLQREPMGEFVPEVVIEYKAFIAKLQARGIDIMLVLHHFCNPNWFVKAGSWENDRTLPMFLDYVRQIVNHFGHLTTYWNTFNEPGVYISNGYFTGQFPPFKKNLWLFNKVLNNMSRAHHLAMTIIRDKHPKAPIGISKNCVIFHPENLVSRIPAAIADKVFMEVVADRFSEGADFIGLSYYARIPMTPKPITEIDTPGKLGKMGRPHDKMWEYYPEGMYQSIKRYWKRYKKPIIITESGICTDDCQIRIQAIKDYLFFIKKAMDEGVPVKGYYHWTTFDNFEWNLGPTYRFGLVHVDFTTGERTMKDSGRFYSNIARTGQVTIDQ